MKLFIYVKFRVMLICFMNIFLPLLMIIVEFIFFLFSTLIFLASPFANGSQSYNLFKGLRNISTRIRAKGIDSFVLQSEKVFKKEEYET